MSLVNKMLRDLDARHAGGDRAALPPAVTPLAAHRKDRSGIPWPWVGMALVAVALGAAAWFGAPGLEQPAALPSVSAPALEVPVAAPVSAAPMVAAAPPASGAAPEPAVVGTGVASSPTTAATLAQTLLRLDDELTVKPMPAQESMRKPAAEAKPPAATVAPLRPAMEALPKVPRAPTEASIDKHVRVPSPAERAEIDYRRGVLAQRQGNADEAAGAHRAALVDHPEHAAARQTLAALLIEAKRFDDAEELLRHGTELASVRMASTLALARLKVERNQAPAALELLQKNAASGERSAEYQGFAGALLNRAGRAAEAVERYQAATRLAPGEGRWWAGLGIALDAAGKGPEAREAYLKARVLPGLPADLAQHVEQRLH